jgi:hypothetical protein
MAGPVASVKLSEDVKLRDALGDYTSNTGEAFKNASYGYQFGVGIKILGMDLDLRREGSLSEISNLDFTQEPQFSQRATGWQLTLGIKIDLGTVPNLNKYTKLHDFFNCRAL